MCVVVLWVWLLVMIRFLCFLLKIVISVFLLFIFSVVISVLIVVLGVVKVCWFVVMDVSGRVSSSKVKFVCRNFILNGFMEVVFLLIRCMVVIVFF